MLLPDVRDANNRKILHVCSFYVRSKKISPSLCFMKNGADYMVENVNALTRYYIFIFIMSPEYYIVQSKSAYHTVTGFMAVSLFIAVTQP